MKATRHKLKLVVSFTFICSNIPAAPAYGVYIFQLIQHSSSTCMWCVHLLVDTTFQLHLPMVYTSLSWYDIPAAPVYGVYISQLIRYSIACGSYHGFLHIGLQLTRKLLKQGFPVVKLKVARSPTWLLTSTEYLCHKWLRICSIGHNHNLVPFLIHDFSPDL